MNQVATQQPKLGQNVAMTNSAGGFAVTPQTLNDIVEFAKFMCQSNFGIPAFLRNNGPDCAAVTMQAMKWGFDPFSVAQKSYKVKDIIAYEAQLIAAVINARSGIKGRLKYQFDGTGDDLTCTVTGSLDGEDCVYTSPRVGNITTKNSPLWKTDPEQQLGYYSSRNWARRHCPEVILGAYDRDEAEEFRGPERAKDITPLAAFDPLSDEPIVQATKHVYADEEFDEMTGELLGANSDSSSPGSDNAEGSSLSAEAGSDSSPSESASTNSDRDILIKYAGDILVKAADQKISPAALAAIEKRYAAEEFPKLSPEGVVKARAISASMRAIANDPARLEGAIEHYAHVLECDSSEIGG